ncbi:MAG: hypothetical protein ABIS44_06590 [Mycobacteriales bacterium]
MSTTAPGRREEKTSSLSLKVWQPAADQVTGQLCYSLPGLWHGANPADYEE